MTQPSQLALYPSTFPGISPLNFPSLPLLTLSEREKQLVANLQLRQYLQRGGMALSEAYYRGEQVMTNLGIALPPELNGLRVVIGWPRIAVDPYVERLAVDSFRLPEETKSDEQLDEIRQAANMPAEETLAFTDALSMRRAYWTISAGDEEGDPVRICAESPLNVITDYDPITRKPSVAFQTYWLEGRQAAALYLPDQTIRLATDDSNNWQVVDRDQHNFGFVPVVCMPNRPRANDRSGASEITPELMSVTDAACRTLVNLTAASEFYSVPQKLILGATAEDFRDPQGNVKSAWETYIGRILALQRDADGALPEIQQFDAYDPSVFTKVIEMYASQAAGILAAPPQDLGLYTQGNPVTAEAAQVSEQRRDRRTKRMQQNFTGPLVEVAQLALRFQNDGELPEKYRNLTVDWTDPAIPDFTGMSDGLSKLVQQGVIPHASDVALRKLGFTAVQRRQIHAEREADPAQKILTELGQSVEGKTIRLAQAVTAAGKPDTEPGSTGSTTKPPSST